MGTRFDERAAIRGDDVVKALQADLDRLVKAHADLWSAYLICGTEEAWAEAHRVHLEMAEVGRKHQAAVEEARQVTRAAHALSQLDG